MTGASARHLAAYRRLRLRTLHIGNEAVVDPRTFSLEGRAIRKVRQSVARIARRGWSVTVVPARGLDAATRAEVMQVERQWHAGRRRIEGFAMKLGRLGDGAGADGHGCYVIARDPHGRVRAFQRFAAYRGGLSLDLCRRLGDEPNGLSEAM